MDCLLSVADLLGSYYLHKEDLACSDRSSVSALPSMTESSPVPLVLAPTPYFLDSAILAYFDAVCRVFEGLGFVVDTCITELALGIGVFWLRIFSVFI